jgi:hypothetical protein
MAGYCGLQLEQPADDYGDVMRWLAALLLCLISNVALAQNVLCPTRPAGDSSNACASTAFVAQNALPLALTQNFVIVGSAGNLAVGVPLSGSCTIVSAGAISCNANALTGTTLASGVVGSSLTSVGNPLTIGASLYPFISASHFHYDPNSSLIANTLGAKNVVIGVPATDPSATWANSISTIDSAQNSTFGPTGVNVVSPTGSNAFASATRSSDQATLTPTNIISNTCIAQHDNTSVAHLMWCGYEAMVVTATAAASHQISREIDTHNLGATAPVQDPFNINPSKSIESLRLATGIPGNGSPNPASSYLLLTNNATTANSGIIVANGALNTGGTANPDALALPPAYSITWYNAAAAKTWQMFAGGGANGALNLNTAGTGAFTIGGQFRANGGFAVSALVTICGAGNTYTVVPADYYLQANDTAATCTVTLPAAASFPGRVLKIKNIGTQLVISASSNVVPLVGGAAGTAILSAAAGKFVEMVSDSGLWVIMAGVP